MKKKMVVQTCVCTLFGLITFCASTLAQVQVPIPVTATYLTTEQDDAVTLGVPIPWDTR